MARRGVMNALQAALAGISGAAGGYVQMEETKRKRQIEDEERKQRQAALEAGLQAGIRSEQRDILKLGGTRIAGMGEQVAGPVPSVIPLSGVGNALAAAEAAGGPATSRGALRQTVGESSFMLPGEGERTARERDTTRAFAEEDFQTTNKRDFETFRAMGGRGEYKPNVVYSRMITDLGASKALAGQRSLIEARTDAAGAGGAAGGSRAERIATLPTVANAAEKLAKMDAKSVSALDGFGVSAASQVPQILTQTRGGFAGMLALPTAALYGKAAGSKEREYAEMTQAISDAVASMVSVGVLTDKDIDRFKQQVQFYPGDESKDKIRKFNSLRSWASWLQSGGEGKYPGETDDEYFQRTSMLRAQPGAGTQARQSQGMGGTTAQADAETEQYRRAWDTVAAQLGEEYAKSKYGERP